ncbi:MAG: HAD family hydrolase [Actinobacteria bacterium]|nr:HAD family hydrolase [Actinomycetota bacterium]
MALLITDLDETLLERRAALRRWATGFAADRELPDGSVEGILEEDRHGARTRAQFVDAVNRRFGLRPPLTLAYLADYVACFELSDAAAAALVEARSAGWRIAIATNGDQPQLDKIDHVGLRPLVDGIAVSDLDGVRKPDPGLLLLAARRAGGDIEGAWMIGDDPVNDIQGAHAAGVRSVWLRRGRTWPVDLEPPTVEATSFAAAVEDVLRAPG